MLKENSHCWWSSELLHKLYYEANQNFTDFTSSIYWVHITEHNHGVPNCFSFPLLKLTEWRITKLEISEQHRDYQGQLKKSWLGQASPSHHFFYSSEKSSAMWSVKIQQKPLETVSSVSFLCKRLSRQGMEGISSWHRLWGSPWESLWAHAFSQRDWWLGKKLHKQLKKLSEATNEVLKETSLV